jgi:predicted permease
MTSMWHRFLSELRFRLRALFRRGDLERELEAELAFHLDREITKHLRSGVPREEGVRRARASFGSVGGVRDDARDARGLVWLETSLQDARYAVRVLRTRKTFAAGVILTLGLGVGANAAMFGIVDRLLFRAPPAMRDADRVHRFYRHTIDDGQPRIDRNFSFATYMDVRRLTRSFDEIAAFQTRRLGVGDGESIREVPVTLATAGYFNLFEARPVIGRFFGAAEDSVPTGSPVAVLGHGFWQAQFGGRAEVIGERIRIDRAIFTIVGVAPEEFVGMSDQGVPALYIPLTAYAFAFRGNSYPTRYGWSWLEIVARRRPEVSAAAAEVDLSAAFQRSWQAMFASDPGWGPPEAVRPRAELGPVQLERGPDAGRESRVATWVSGVALIVLLVACANVANLLLTRAVGRQREIAVRLTLGVSRGRLVRQLLTENLLLALLGGALGLAIAQWGTAGLRALFLPGDEPVTVLTDGRTLLFAGAATLVAALLTGLAPALHAGRANVAVALKSSAREGTTPRSRTRTALLVLQAALSVILLVGAGLFVRSLQNVRAFRLGYDVEPLLFATANARGTNLDDAAVLAVNQRMLDVARSLPGVSHAVLAASVPFWSNEGRGLWVPGVDSINRRGRFVMQAASSGYFDAMGTRVLRGRPFDDRDATDAPRVVVVSEGMARIIWPGKDAIGECIRIGSDTVPCSTVIGVAEDMRVRSLTDAREFAYYIPISQYDAVPYPQLFIRVQGLASDHVAAMRRALQAVMPGASYVTVLPLSRLIDPNVQAWRFGATMFVAFGGLALVLAAIGLYSLIAYGVAQRTHELGVRMALGAPAVHVVRLIVVGGVRLAVVGIAIGGAIALWIAPRLESVLFQQSPRDPAVFGGVAVVLMGVALLASAVPALRAARVDPNLTLRSD